MPIEVERVSDEELEFDAKAKGPRRPEAQALARLRSQRSRDRQVYAFKFGHYVMIGAWLCGNAKAGSLTGLDCSAA
jgi:hypothetical protein